MLASPERWLIALFSQSALISQLIPIFFEKLKYHSLGHKDYSRKLFWAVVVVVDNTSDVWVIVSPLVVSRNKVLVGSMDEVVETISIWQFLRLWYGQFLTVNPFSANFTKWSNTLKQFVGNFPTNCLSVFDHFVGLVLKGLKPQLLQRLLTTSLFN